MAKRAVRVLPKGELTIPFQPFYSDPLPIGTICEIVEDEGDRYIVKFPKAVGFSGTHHIQKHYVNPIENPHKGIKNG
jgi:hypothetical protein